MRGEILIEQIENDNSFLALSHRRDAGQQFGKPLRCKELITRLARLGGIHRHEVLIGIAESVYSSIVDIAKLHISDVNVKYFFPSDNLYIGT